MRFLGVRARAGITPDILPSELTSAIKDALSANRPHLIEISERRLADS